MIEDSTLSILVSPEPNVRSDIFLLELLLLAVKDRDQIVRREAMRHIVCSISHTHSSTTPLESLANIDVVQYVHLLKHQKPLIDCFDNEDIETKLLILDFAENLFSLVNHATKFHTNNRSTVYHDSKKRTDIPLLTTLQFTFHLLLLGLQDFESRVNHKALYNIRLMLTKYKVLENTLDENSVSDLDTYEDLVNCLEQVSNKLKSYTIGFDDNTNGSFVFSTLNEFFSKFDDEKLNMWIDQVNHGDHLQCDSATTIEDDTFLFQNDVYVPDIDCT